MVCERARRAGALALLLLGGCVSYQPRPLAQAPRWSPLPASAAGQALPRLDLAQAAALALHDNPDYRAALTDARISTLQLRAAGLLPDPQLSASTDHPSTPGYSRAWGLGLSEDVSWLLTRGATLDTARAQRTATVLNLACGAGRWRRARLLISSMRGARGSAAPCCNARWTRRARARPRSRARSSVAT
ncbi:outer membrane efflux protein [mine drainage metagenome]|uniref:Outer membrane efflux protein n=1 Tax=mine drainage metagenome TaxID=410659 RepID=T0YB50_9ZZZZ